MDAQATAKATTTAQPKAATGMNAMNPSAPANKQTECQKANRLRGGGAGKDCFLGMVECFLCFECCKGICECCADIICCPCEMCC